jgi:hypothetical protein
MKTEEIKPGYHWAMYRGKPEIVFVVNGYVQRMGKHLSYLLSEFTFIEHIPEKKHGEQI